MAFFGRNFGREAGTLAKSGLASFLMHLCAALVHRNAFFGRNFGAVFEHAKTQITKEHYTAMSHYVTLAEGAPRGVEMRDLSKGTERSVR